MSAGTRLPLAEALVLAEALRDRLAPACERIVVAGSIRRLRPTIGDLELVALPRITAEASGDLWASAHAVDRLADRLAQLASAGELVPRQVRVTRADGRVEAQRRQGPAYQALAYRGVPVDLFIVRPPAAWGVILALRTGPWDWNVRLVSEARRIGRRVAGGQVLSAAGPIACPEEEDFFAALGQAWVAPPEREPERVHLVAPHPAVGVR